MRDRRKSRDDLRSALQVGILTQVLYREGEPHYGR